MMKLILLKTEKNIIDSLQKKINNELLGIENYCKNDFFINNIIDNKNFTLIQLSEFFIINNYEPIGISFNVPLIHSIKDINLDQNKIITDNIAFVFKKNNEIKWMYFTEKYWYQLLLYRYSKKNAETIMDIIMNSNN